MAEEKKSLEYEAGSVLVNDGIIFPVPFILGTKLRLKIKPLCAETIVRISMQVSKLKKIDESIASIPAALSAGTNYKIFSRIIAIAVINSRVPGRLFTGFLTKLFLWKMKPEEILVYKSLAYRQMDHQRFFFIMMSAMGMNYLEKKIETEKPVEAKPSGAPLR